MIKNKNLLNDSFFDDINGKSLDIYQRKIVINNSKSLLVVAGAGSGKTLTIIGKIKYLIEKEKIDAKNILCISFTNETVNNLKNRVGYNIDCFTFHKLSLSILKDFNYNYQIINDDLLEYIIEEFFDNIIYQLNITNLVIEYMIESLKEKDMANFFSTLRLKKQKNTELELYALKAI